MPTKDKTHNGETNPQPSETKMVQAPDFKLLYVNHIQASFTPFDISFLMSEALGAEEGKFLIQMKARVTMSPVEAKVFQKIISDTIKNFEKTIGPVTVPDNMMPEDTNPSEGK